MFKRELLIVLAGATIAMVLGAGFTRGQGRKAQAKRAETQREDGLKPSSAVRGPAKGANEEDRGAPAVRVGSEEAKLSAVRFVSSKTYTRVMIDLSQEARFETHRLKANPAKGLPPRIYIDIFGARVGLESKEPIKVNDGLLRRVRVAQFNKDVVRVVLDMTSLRSHHVYFLSDPYRLVVDIQGRNAPDMPSPLTDTKAVGPPPGAKRATAGIHKIVLDPGHGGKDPGAIGVDGLAEKDIVLSVALKLARKLKREMGIDVVLTRKDDRFVPLEERTAIANAENADLFVSLHMNASPNHAVRGLETYYLDNTTDEASIRLAARENGTAPNKISDLQFILSDMTQNMKLEDSITLADRLQRSLVRTMGRQMTGVKDLGVKKALFYVLVGARMPSVLVEMFFITNKRDGRAMAQERYQDDVVDALYEGIREYSQTVVAAKTL